MVISVNTPSNHPPPPHYNHHFFSFLSFLMICPSYSHPMFICLLLLLFYFCFLNNRRSQQTSRQRPSNDVTRTAADFKEQIQIGISQCADEQRSPSLRQLRAAGPKHRPYTCTQSTWPVPRHGVRPTDLLSQLITINYLHRMHLVDGCKQKNEMGKGGGIIHFYAAGKFMSKSK